MAEVKSSGVRPRRSVYSTRAWFEESNAFDDAIRGFYGIMDRKQQRFLSTLSAELDPARQEAELNRLRDQLRKAEAGWSKAQIKSSADIDRLQKEEIALLGKVKPLETKRVVSREEALKSAGFKMKDGDLELQDVEQSVVDHAMSRLATDPDREGTEKEEVEDKEKRIQRLGEQFIKELAADDQFGRLASLPKRSAMMARLLDRVGQKNPDLKKWMTAKVGTTGKTNAEIELDKYDVEYDFSDTKQAIERVGTTETTRLGPAARAQQAAIERRLGTIAQRMAPGPVAPFGATTLAQQLRRDIERQTARVNRARAYYGLPPLEGEELVEEATVQLEAPPQDLTEEEAETLTQEVVIPSATEEVGFGGGSSGGGGAGSSWEEEQPGRYQPEDWAGPLQMRGEGGEGEEPGDPDMKYFQGDISARLDLAQLRGMKAAAAAQKAKGARTARAALPPESPVDWLAYPPESDVSFDAYPPESDVSIEELESFSFEEEDEEEKKRRSR